MTEMDYKKLFATDTEAKKFEGKILNLARENGVVGSLRIYGGRRWADTVGVTMGGRPTERYWGYLISLAEVKNLRESPELDTGELAAFMEHRFGHPRTDVQAFWDTPRGDVLFSTLAAAAAALNDQLAHAMLVKVLLHAWDGIGGVKADNPRLQKITQWADTGGAGWRENLLKGGGEEFVEFFATLSFQPECWIDWAKKMVLAYRRDLLQKHEMDRDMITVIVDGGNMRIAKAIRATMCKHWAQRLVARAIAEWKKQQNKEGRRAL